MSIQQFVSYMYMIMVRTVNFQWDDDEVRFVLDQHTEWDFNSVSSLKQQSVDRHVSPLRYIIPIPSQPVYTHSFSLILHA